MSLIIPLVCLRAPSLLIPETIIRELFRIWISVYEFPEKFLSDNGGEFANHKFRELCEAANIVAKTTAAESPWSNGLCERHNLFRVEWCNWNNFRYFLGIF